MEEEDILETEKMYKREIRETESQKEMKQKQRKYAERPPGREKMTKRVKRYCKHRKRKIHI